jgi:hypothetical protein
MDLVLRVEKSSANINDMEELNEIMISGSAQTNK